MNDDPRRAPTRVGRRDPSRIVLDWPDGASTTATSAELRRACPCAHCVDERTGAPLLDPSTVPDDLEHARVELIGNYALSIVFSDGHGTGIYTWGALRDLTRPR